MAQEESSTPPADPMKAISKSVSMPAAMWAVLEQFAHDQNPAMDRSQWLRSVAIPHLEAGGVWPIDGLPPEDRVLASRIKKLEALAALGVDVDQVLLVALNNAGTTPPPATGTRG